MGTALLKGTTEITGQHPGHLPERAGEMRRIKETGFPRNFSQ